MASRQFAYNPTQSVISGTTNVGTLCVGNSPLDYNVALTDTQILENFNATKSRFGL
jgi:hypothetical protein